MSAPVTRGDLARNIVGRALLFAPSLWLLFEYGDSLSFRRLAAMMLGFMALAVVDAVRFSRWLHGHDRPPYWAYLERGAWLLLFCAPAFSLYAATGILAGVAFGGSIVGAALYTVVPFYARWKVRLEQPGVLLLRRGWARRRVAIRDVQGLAYDRWSGWLVLDDGERYPLADDLSAATIIGARAAG